MPTSKNVVKAKVRLKSYMSSQGVLENNSA